MDYNFYCMYGHVFKKGNTIVHENEYLTISYQPADSNLKACYLGLCNDLMDLEAASIRPKYLRNRIIKIK
ncbi:hypothetical protein IGI37_000118 [Enterococcus sp. AZ194]